MTNELPYETKARGMTRGASERVRGKDGARWTDTVDKEIADAMDEAARVPLCVYHAGRAADAPTMVRAPLWTGLVTRWAKQKCGRCRGIPDAPVTMDDAGLDAILRDVRDVIETRRAGRAPDVFSGLATLRARVLGRTAWTSGARPLAHATARGTRPEPRAATVCAWHAGRVGACLILTIGRGTRDVSHGICPACRIVVEHDAGLSEG